MPKYESMYEERFSYIDDDNLRKHMWDTLEFIVHILAISSKFPEKARNYFYKTCILYTASIIESQIHFCIKKMGHKEIEKEKIWDYKNPKVIYKDSCNDTTIISCIRKRPKIPLNNSIDFKLLNEFSKKIWLYGNNMYWEINKIRELRNQIHLMKLKHTHRIYPKEQLDQIFATTRELLKIIEERLTITTHSR